MNRPWERLTGKQREVLRLVLDGSTPEDIASTLNVSRASVHRHLNRALAVLREEDVSSVSTTSPLGSLSGDRQVITIAELLMFCRSLAHAQVAHGTPWSMAVIAGHPAASSLSLTMVSPLSLVRATDRLALDGDFLAIVLPDTHITGAERLLERLRVAARQATVFYGSGAVEARDGEAVADTYQRARRLAERSLLEEEARRIMGRGVDGI